jgi:hypothetical protein
MSSTPSSGQTPRSGAGPRSKPPGVPTDFEAENTREGDLSEDVNKLSRDMAGLKDTISRFMSQTGSDAAKTVRGMSHTVASQVSSAAGGVVDTGSDLASSAKERWSLASSSE